MTGHGPAARPTADLLIEGAIHTLGGSGLGTVAAIAIGDGVILGAGERTALDALTGPRTRRWRITEDLCVLPGITDAHLHLRTAAFEALGLRLGALTGRDAVEEAIAAADMARRWDGDADGWLLGDGWSPDQLGGWPTADDLERVAPGRPVALWSHDHHARWLSRVALDLVGLTSGLTRTGVPGGLVRRDAEGRPTGILHEGAAVLVDRVIPERTDAQSVAAVGRYAQDLLRLGVTGVHDPGELAVTRQLTGPDLYRRMAVDGALPIEVVASVREPQLPTAVERGMRTGVRHGRYRDGWLKLFADGALGSRTAALLEPYEPGDPAGPPGGGPAGMVTHAPGAMRSVSQRAAAHGIATQVHGIGDAAVRSALDVLQDVARVGDALHRVEHAQLVHPADVPRFAALRVAASVQPCHLCSDATAIAHAWGARSAHAFPLADLDRSGAVMPLGTDAPVESPDPWRNLAAAVRRADPTWPAGQPAFHAGQSLGIARAVRAACVDPWLTLGDPVQGRLVAGSPATLLVVPVAGLRDAGERGQHLAATRPLTTLVDGVVAWLDATFDP